MRQAVFLAGFAAIAAASPAAQAINFASVNAAPLPSLTSPPIGTNTQDVPYNSALVAAEGSAAATGVASASATTSQAGNNKRGWGPIWGWPRGSQPQTTSSQGWGSPGKPTSTPQPTTWTTSSSGPSVSPTTISSQTQSLTATATTSSDSSCPTQPEAGTYCGFINPEDACAVQPDGYEPHVEPDTVEAFEAYAEFHEEAKSAKAPPATPNIRRPQRLRFNIFVERDPSLNPSENCTLPASITNYKCTLWGSGVDAASATNYGDYRGQFQVLIAGSDGFEKTNTTTPAQCPGWQPTQQCGSKGHDHPSTCIGTGFFPGPYNPAICAAYAEAQNAVNEKSSIWQKWIQIFTGNYNPLKCDFFNSYMLKKNGKALGTYCGLYSQQYSGGEATYVPGWQGADFWSIESSWSFSIEVEGQNSWSWW